ncbi:helix-turn-helix transcriptional regulator [Dactylosporangium sp. NPDC000244]|uniref:helix-turn-helix domain-containing protein n=1 Tax=Dactylosporangium sp. NPDC000244 TaxID=3154365 RepID=UPI003323C604
MEPPRDWLTGPDGLASQLARLREAASLQGKELASVAGWAPSKVSRIENGRQTPSAEDIDAWVNATSASAEQRKELLHLLDEGLAAQRDWRRKMGSGQVAVQKAHSDYTANASLIRYFDNTFVTGFLQTREYAHRVLTEIRRINDLPIDDVDAAVTLRMQRQQMLYDGAKRFEFLITEAVLRYRLIPAEGMRAQLDRLQTVVDQPNIRFGVIPFEATLPTAPSTSFQLYGDDLAVVENAFSEQENRGEEAARWIRLMDLLWDEAVTGGAARRLIIAAADALS